MAAPPLPATPSRPPASTLVSLVLDDYGDGIGRAATVLRANAGASGLDAPVPTCPGWTVLDLVAHIGMVHRWAASHVRGEARDEAATEVAEREGRDAADPLGWFDTGATALLQAIVDAPDDLQALVFLQSAPPARLFWARRQCHETTIHAVDALAARLRRAPLPEETWIKEPLALDGLDELLRGFVPRRGRGLRSEHETRYLISPDGTAGWLVELAPDRPAVTTVLGDGAGVEDVDHVLTGTAVDLYLRLWSRADEPRTEGEQWWRQHLSVSWS